MDSSVQFINALHSLQQRAYYPSPFFDVAKQFMPNNIKEMLRWCRFYFYTHHVVYRVITTLAEYPITDIVIEAPDEKLKEKYQEIFKALKLRTYLIKFALDSYTYGNCFASIHFPFLRFLRCKQCGQKVKIENMQYKITNYVPKGICLKCNKETSFEIQDVKSHDVSEMRLRTWNPLNIDIEHNEISGEKYYYLMVPGRVRRGVLCGSPIYWESTPAWVIEAVKQEKYAKFAKGKLYHFARPSVTDEMDEWGKSVILPVLREIFHFYTLRKAQQSIAIDRIIPLRYLYPETQASNMGPLYDKVDLGEWKDRIEEEMRKWKNDPLYVSIMPIPLGSGSIGGDARALMVFQEMEATNNWIENGLGMPTGFMSGNVTYSGGNVVLRMLENSFITDRDQREEFLQWVVDEVATYLGINKVRVRMKEFKMADDMERKRLLEMLNEKGKVSDDTLFSELDMSASDEMEKVMQESADKSKKYLEVQVKMADMVQGFINQLNEMEAEQRNSILSKMQQEMPETYSAIVNKIKPPAVNAVPTATEDSGGENPVMPPEAGGASMN